jgi:uncharacterized damage-inducible protein DinB
LIHASTLQIRKENTMANTTTQPTTEREHYLSTFEREYQCTLRILKAYPANQAQYKPAERSNTAMQTAWTLVISQFVTEPILTATTLAPQQPPPAPGDWSTLVSTFEQAHKDATKRLTAMPDSVFTSTFVMAAGPKGATATIRRADALWMMLFDTVHHRGQLSVYLRATGAKVPSIYGPSGDEPWM